MCIFGGVHFQSTPVLVSVLTAGGWKSQSPTTEIDEYRLILRVQVRKKCYGSDHSGSYGPSFYVYEGVYMCIDHTCLEASHVLVGLDLFLLWCWCL